MASQFGICPQDEEVIRARASIVTRRSHVSDVRRQTGKHSQLLAIDLVVLRGSDLPLTVALQPGIGPDLALLRVWMRFVFADGVLAAVNDGHVVARR
jgi:hypothetical protein